jgi:hypothetical protein
MIPQTIQDMNEPMNTFTADLMIESDYFDGDKIKLSLKSKRDNHINNPSGWSIIAFSPSASIRCVRGNQAKHVDIFIRTLQTLIGNHDELVFFEIRDAIARITQAELAA